MAEGLCSMDRRGFRGPHGHKPWVRCHTADPLFDLKESQPAADPRVEIASRRGDLAESEVLPPSSQVLRQFLHHRKHACTAVPVGQLAYSVLRFVDGA